MRDDCCSDVMTRTLKRADHVYLAPAKTIIASQHSTGWIPCLSLNQQCQEHRKHTTSISNSQKQQRTFICLQNTTDIIIEPLPVQKIVPCSDIDSDMEIMLQVENINITDCQNVHILTEE